MERRGHQERELGMPNSMGYTPPPPQIIQESSSPVKLPLAPILSTPPDRRGIAVVSTRRGSSIFSPVQTLDHHYNPPPPQPHHRHLSPPPPPPPPQPLVQKDPTPDPDPSPTPAPPPPPPPQAPPPQPRAPPANSIRYRECLKNHAASMGGHVVDGCGEFMPSGEDGSPESLRCAACDCHRNFHRKEVDGEPPPQQPHHYLTYNNPNSANNNSNNNHRQIQSSAPPSRHHQQHHNKHFHSYSHGGVAYAAGPTPPTMVNFGGNGGGGAAAESSSEDLNMYHSSGGGNAAAAPLSGSRKRFRTKFSEDQKNRMHEFASKLGWRIQKQDDQEVQRFCSEVGVKRQVFKVWMHNNKQAMKKRSQSE